MQCSFSFLFLTRLLMSPTNTHTHTRTVADYPLSELFSQHSPESLIMSEVKASPHKSTHLLVWTRMLQRCELTPTPAIRMTLAVKTRRRPALLPRTEQWMDRARLAELLMQSPCVGVRNACLENALKNVALSLSLSLSADTNNTNSDRA